MTFARIEPTQPMLNEFITVAPQPAMAAARAAGRFLRIGPAGCLRPRPDCKPQLS